MIKRVVLIFAIAIIAFAITSMAWASELDDIIRRGVVRIAIPQDTPPYGMMSVSGDFEGYDVDIAELIAKELGVRLEKVPVISKNRIPFLIAGKVDLIISSLGATPKRAQSIWFSNPYGPFFWGVWGPKNIRVSSAADTEGYTVGATLGTLEELAFTEMAPRRVNIRRYDDQATTVQAFLSGHVDLIVTGSPIAATMIKQNPHKKIERKFIIQHSPCHIGIRKGEVDLLYWVNVFIYRKKLSGDLDKLSKKWFGESLPELPAF